jgi:hypothetical protein
LEHSTRLSDTSALPDIYQRMPSSFVDSLLDCYITTTYLSGIGDMAARAAANGAVRGAIFGAAFAALAGAFGQLLGPIGGMAAAGAVVGGGRGAWGARQGRGSHRRAMKAKWKKMFGKKEPQGDPDPAPVTM